MILGQSALRFRSDRVVGGRLLMTWNSGVRDMIKESKNFARFKCQTSACSKTFLLIDEVIELLFTRQELQYIPKYAKLVRKTFLLNGSPDNGSIRL